MSYLLARPTSARRMVLSPVRSRTFVSTALLFNVAEVPRVLSLDMTAAGAEATPFSTDAPVVEWGAAAKHANAKRMTARRTAEDYHRLFFNPDVRKNNREIATTRAKRTTATQEIRDFENYPTVSDNSW